GIRVFHVTGVQTCASSDLGVPFRETELFMDIEGPEPGARRRRCFDVVLLPLVGANGKIDGVLLDAVDLTDQVAAREEIAARAREVDKLNVNLERRLAYLSALREIDTAISASVDLQLTLRVFLDQVTRHLD